MTMGPRVIVIDACKKGWAGITSDRQGYFGGTIDQLKGSADRDGESQVIAIDIPIGLPLAGPRKADALARSLIGKRASSVFSYRSEERWQRLRTPKPAR